MSYGLVLTNAGAAEIETAYHAGKTVAIMQVALGDGGGTALPVTPAELAQVSQLAGQFGSESFSAADIDAGMISGQVVIPCATYPGKTLREVGLVSASGTLVAYGTYPDTYIPDENSAVFKEISLTLVMALTHAESVSIEVDPYIAIITQETGDGRYLQQQQNLADIDDAATARKNLGLGSVGNFMAVQQGGAAGMLDNKTHIGWSGEVILAQVDDTPMGALYYENNPPPYPVTSVNDKTGAVSLGKSDVGLGSVGNWLAVQANGGKHSTGEHHRYYVDWNDGVYMTVDETDLGQVFTESHPPTAAQTGAYPMSGGYLGEEASVSLISSSKNPANGDYIYSPMYRVLIKGRGGDQDFKDGASGFMRIVEHVGYEAFLQLQWDGFGSAHEFRFDQNGNTLIYGKAYTGSGASFLAEDGNVYGPVWGGWLSNWVNNNFQSKNTGNPGGGWWRDSATGLIIQAGTVAVPVSGSSGSASFSFPLTFPNGVVSVVGSTADQASAAGYVACAAFQNLTTAGAHVLVDTNASRNMDRTQYVRYVAYGV